MSARWVALTWCLACALAYVLHTYETFVVTTFSPGDPFGGITLYRRDRTPCDADLCAKIVPVAPPNDGEKATVVLMGYKTSRAANYRTLFESYAAMTDTVDRVVFIWNNLDADPPEVPPGLRDRVVVIRAERNDMMNRYALAHPSARTDAMLTIDDDVLISEGLLRCMLSQLRVHGDSIVGLDARHVDAATGNYAGGLWLTPTEPNVIIGKTMLMSKANHERATEASDELRESVFPGAPCESCDDLVMNAIAAAATGKGPVKLRHNIWPHVRAKLPAPGGVSNKANWYGPRGRRSECVRWLQRHFAKQTPFLPRAVPQEFRCVEKTKVEYGG